MARVSCIAYILHRPACANASFEPSTSMASKKRLEGRSRRRTAIAIALGRRRPLDLLVLHPKAPQSNKHKRLDVNASSEFKPRLRGAASLQGRSRTVQPFRSYRTGLCRDGRSSWSAGFVDVYHRQRVRECRREQHKQHRKLLRLDFRQW